MFSGCPREEKEEDCEWPKNTLTCGPVGKCTRSLWIFTRAAFVESILLSLHPYLLFPIVDDQLNPQWTTKRGTFVPHGGGNKFPQWRRRNGRINQQVMSDVDMEWISNSTCLREYNYCQIESTYGLSDAQAPATPGEAPPVSSSFHSGDDRDDDRDHRLSIIVKGEMNVQLTFLQMFLGFFGRSPCLPGW